MNPMVSYLTGWLSACVSTRAGDVMKITELRTDSPDAFMVKFASGLELRVKVGEVPRTRGTPEAQG